jgi:hypothetical protein
MLRRSGAGGYNNSSLVHEHRQAGIQYSTELPLMTIIVHADPALFESDLLIAWAGPRRYPFADAR